MKKEKGIAFITTIALMVVLSILGVAMVLLSRYETGNVVRSVVSEQAFYIAEGGVEWAISQLKSDPDYTGETASLGDGEFTVVVTSLGDDRYRIDSTGRVPATNPKATRKIEAVIQRNPGVPEEVCRAGGDGIRVNDATTIVGTLKAAGLITVNATTNIVQDENGNGNVYACLQHLFDWGWGSMVVNAPLNMASTAKVRARCLIFGKSNITGTTDIQEWYVGPETSPMSFPSVDEDELTDGAVQHPETTPPDPLDLNGQVHEFTASAGWGGDYLEFGVVNGTGTIAATGGKKVAFNANLGTTTWRQPLNVCVFNVSWLEWKDLVFNSTSTYITGFLYGENMLQINSNQIFDFEGTIEVSAWSVIAPAIEINGNTFIKWASLDYPPPGLQHVNVDIISWKEE